MPSLEGLNAGLLVGADDRAIARWAEIEVNDRTHLGGKVRVDGLLPVGAAVRSDGSGLEDALDATSTDRKHPTAGGQDLGQEAATPIRMASQTVLGRLLTRGGHDQASLLRRDSPRRPWPSQI